MRKAAQGWSSPRIHVEIRAYFLALIRPNPPNTQQQKWWGHRSEVARPKFIPWVSDQPNPLHNPNPSSFLVQLAAGPVSFSRPTAAQPNSLSFSLPLADEWARLVSTVFFPEPSPGRTRSSSALFKRAANPLNPQTQSCSFRRLFACAAAAIRASKRLLAASRTRQASNLLLSRSLVLARARQLELGSSVFHDSRLGRKLGMWGVDEHPAKRRRQRRTATGAVRPVTAKTGPVSTVFLTLAAAVEPSDPEPIDPTRVKPSRTGQPRLFAEKPLENGPFEGDQDQVYEEEQPQYFEEGNAQHRDAWLDGDNGQQLVINLPTISLSRLFTGHNPRHLPVPAISPPQQVNFCNAVVALLLIYLLVAHYCILPCDFSFATISFSLR
nr:unnamed protein product [Digitaria exilis]